MYAKRVIFVYKKLRKGNKMLVFLSATQLELIKSKDPISKYDFVVGKTKYSVIPVKSLRNPEMYDVVVKNVNTNKPVLKMSKVSFSKVNSTVLTMKNKVTATHLAKAVDKKWAKNRRMKSVKKSVKKVK